MALEFLSFLTSDTSMILFFVIFVIFIIIAYKVFKFLFKAFLVGLVAALFPVFGNLVFGLDIELSLFSIFWFAVTGVGLFLLYTVLKIIWKFLKTMTSPFRGKKKSKD